MKWRWLVPFLLWAGVAQAQNVTVIGPVTPGNVPLFSSTTVLKDSGGVPLTTALAPSFPNLHPASTNLVCANGHFLPWVDQSWCLSGDTINWTSTDPSALLAFTLSGTVTNASLQTWTFTFGSGACVAGCAVTYTTVGGDTLASVAQAMVNAVLANTNLYNNVSGAQKQVLTARTYGGPPATSVSIDFDSRFSMKVVATDAGGTINYNLPGSCGTACANAWDNNPVFATARFVSGIAPASGSSIFALYAISNDSASLTGLSTQYGVFSNTILNSTHGAISSRWALTTPDVNGVINGGLYVTRGVHTVGFSDSGLDTMTTGAFNALGSSGCSATGQGICVIGAGSNSILSKDFGANTYQATTFQASSWDFKPSNSATSGFQITDNIIKPDTNAGVQLGDATHNFASIFARNLLLFGSSSGVVTIQPQAAAGTFNFNLPTSAGSSGQPLLSAGGGASPMTFGTLGATVGGTGQTVYSVGDLLYADTTTTLAKLSDVATGRLLASGGVNTAPAYTVTPTLGASGTLGSLTFGNATSGLLTLQTVTGVLGTVTVSLPAATGTVGLLSLAQTWTAQQSFSAKPLIAFANGQMQVSDSGTSFSFIDIIGGGDTGFRFGQEGTGSGGNLIVGSNAGDAVVDVRDNKRLLFGTNNTAQIFVNASGGMGIGSATDPGAGGLIVNGATITLTGLATDATHTDRTVCQDTTSKSLFFGSGAAGICLGTSSVRFKHDVSRLTEGLDQITRLEPVSYKLNADHGDPNKVLYGFTAEQGATVLPELVGEDAQGLPQTFDYMGVVPVLVRAVQELKADNDNLRAELNLLAAKVK